jgi:cytochrome b561
MMIVATRSTRTAILLHWRVAALIIGNVVPGWIIDDLPIPTFAWRSKSIS